MNRHWLAPLLVLSLIPGVGRAEVERPLLLQHPTLSKTQVVFVYGGDLWTVARQGGDARRLTGGLGLESHPVFSPDGSQIAFAGEYEGNLDVYVVPAAGGEPRRLTYHPGMDVPVGWTPDGKEVLFRSARNSHARFRRLFSVPVEGGNPSELPLPMAEEGSFSPDGKRIAYVPFWNRSNSPLGHIAWKRYRGGLASPVWVANLENSAVEKLPRDKSNDFNPMWVGDRIYFLSDRAGPVTLFAYDVAAKQVQQLLPNQGPDIKSASAGPGAIVYDQFGELHLYDLETKKAKRLEVRVAGDLASVRPRFEKVAKKVQKARLSPTGARAVFEARGEILTVPTGKGDVRNLTRTPGVAERDPSWSPDGQTLAYFSDESGEYQLHLRPQNGLGEVKKITLDRTPSFYSAPVWSPDGKKIAYTDKRMNFWFVDLETSQSTLVDTGPYEGMLEPPSWSPDGKWLAYVKQLKSSYSAVFLYSLDRRKHYQVTDGFSDALTVAFDRGGKHLYFLTSTDAGPATMAGMSTYNRGVTRSAYLVVLNKDDPSPLAPESDEEKKESADKEKEKDKDKGKKEAVKVRIDLEDIDQRILALPIPARNYVGLLAGKVGTLFLLEGPPIPPSDGSEETGPKVIVHRFELEKRKPEKLTEDARHVAVSHNGEKLLYQKGEGWFVTAAAGPVKPGEGALKLDGLEVRVDPRAEWRQMYREVWRIERDFLYDPNFHGYDLKAAEQRFTKYLPGIASRYDFNYLLEEMLGELSLGHVYIFGGDVPQAQGPKTGLLGADYRVENGRYRFARIYRGENWNPQLRAPLTQPGARVKEGEYLLAVDGQDVRPAEEVHAAFQGKAGKTVVLRVGANPDGGEAREVTVVPVADEYSLRHLAWVEDNRRKVDRLSGGQLAYIYIPNTATEGFTRFNREFFAQAGKDGAVVDERFNGGGNLADHVIDYLRQPLRNYITFREGEDLAFPAGAIFGPKVMIINEQAGSGGDYMPYIFRQSKVGLLVGKRTWGGLVGIGGYPVLIDGGTVTAPRMAIWFPNGKWDVENVGVSPDVEVEFDPKAVRAGHDPQLEKAVELVLEELKKNPPRRPRRPPFPNYHAEAAKLKEELLAAARKGDAEGVKVLLTKGADVNAKTDYGVTPLALAADKGHVEVIKVLLQHQADVNSKDTFYQATPLTWASMRGRAVAAALLVEAGAEGAEGVLSMAASNGQADMVRALLGKKKFKPQTLNSALAAAPANQKEIVELLTKAGAKPPAKQKSPVDRATLAAYVGTYRSDQGGEIRLAAEGDKLVGSSGGKSTITLTAVDKNTFTLAGAEGVLISFSRDGDKIRGFSMKQDKGEVVFKRVNRPADDSAPKPAVVEDKPGVVKAPGNWPSFRGPSASGIADGQFPPITWDAEKGTNIRWKTPIPGLGHSCPVVWEGRVFVTTAVSGDPKATFRPGQYGDVDSVEDKSVHTWNLYCLDKKTGQILWERTAHKGIPKVKRHMKGTHANPTPAVDAGHIVACFGSEGLYCYDHQGELLWRRDLGTLASGWFYDADYQWGFGSSPVIYRDRVIVQCDVGKRSFLAAYRLSDGKEVWRTPREEIPSWGTPTIVEGPQRVELVTNATKFARGYDPLTGKELWRLGRHAEITVPTPVYGGGLIFVTSGYRPVQPIYAIRPGAKGDISLKSGQTANDSILWSTEKGGPYMPTPLVYSDYLYVCSNAGIVTCREVQTGKQVYKERLGGRGGYTASPVAADGKLYFVSEEDGVRVVAAGPKFRLLAVNPLGDPCMATPAISDGMLFVRTQHFVLGIGRK